MDFETKYQAGSAVPFSQKNEMFKRARWDPELREAAKRFYGLFAPREKARPGYRHEDIALRNASWMLEMGFAQGTIQKDFGLFSWDNRRVAPNELPDDLVLPGDDPAYNARLVKRAAGLFGADLVGICRMDRRWVYSKGYHLVTREEYDIEIPDDYQYVINMAVASDYTSYQYAPTFPAASAVGLGYSKMAYVAGLTAQFLRQLGYGAIPSGNDTALSVPLAIQAGLGELGRNGILITRSFGPRVRLCKIFTDLPLDCDHPIEFGVTHFCDQCKKCAKFCPSRAIPETGRTTQSTRGCSSQGPLKWYVDCEKCFLFWSKNGVDCGNCIRVCPFNKPPGALHDMTRWFIDRFPAAHRIILKADDIFGYGKQADPAGFWDLR